MAAETRPRRNAWVIAAAVWLGTVPAGGDHGLAAPQLSPPNNVRFLLSSVVFPSAQGVQIIDGFNRPEDPGTTWAPTVTRMVLKNQTTGFVLKTTTPCALAGGVVQKLMPITTTRRSYLGARLGTYYDAIVPLTSANCSTATYLYVDVEAKGQTSVKVGDATIGLEYHGTAPAKASLPLMVGFSNYAMVLGYCGKWCAAEVEGIHCQQMLVDHRLQPYRGMVSPWNGTDNPDFRTNNRAFATHYLYVPNLTGTNLTNVSSLLTSLGIAGAWSYNADEPSESDLQALGPILAAQKAAAPNIRTMVTTPLRTGMSIDIYAPVAEQLGVNGFPAYTAYKGKSLWMYVSCMSHACGVDRSGSGNPDTDPLYTPSGAPDLVIDRTGAEAFGFYLMGYKYSLEALLYYDSTQQWTLWPKGIDPWIDMYDFGGNGDGTLLYPDRTLRRPYPSIRLKLLREASYTVDALKAVPDQAWVKGQVDLLVRTTLDWDRDMAKIAALRNAALGRLK